MTSENIISISFQIGSTDIAQLDCTDGSCETNLAHRPLSLSATIPGTVYVSGIACWLLSDALPDHSRNLTASKVLKSYLWCILLGC